MHYRRLRVNGDPSVASQRVPWSERFDSMVSRGDGCWSWLGRLNGSGYGQLHVADRIVLAHRFAWERATGVPVPDGYDVLHTCDVRKCVRNEGGAGTYWANGAEHPRHGHLWLGTIADNNADRDAKGRTRGIVGARGVDHRAAKLTEAEVAQIRALGRVGVIARLIAPRFGVSRGHVAGILTRRFWAHVA